MADVRAVKTGNWSDTTVWNTGALPTSADDVWANTFTITIDTSPTVLSIRNGSTTNVTAGGVFVPTNGITLTCTATNGIVSGPNSAIPVLSSTPTAGLPLGQSCTIVSNIAAAAGSSQTGITFSSLGTINVVGTLTGSTVGGLSVAILFSGPGILNVTGNCFGSSGQQAISVTGSGTLNFTGNCVGANAAAVTCATATVNITGNCTGGSSANGAGVTLSGAGTLSVIGTITSTNTSPGISSSSATATVNLTGPFITSANGTNPVYALNWKWASTAPATYYQVRSANTLVIRALYTADSVGGNPATSNVRSGTVYGPNSELTGTCAVPPAASVGVGVPVDNTTGTAAITAASIRSAMGLAAADLDTQLAALPTAAEVRIEMDGNSTKLANLDATVSSRSTYAGADTSGTTTLLSRLTSGRAGNLDNLDATISSRLATSGYTTPPSAGDIATAVWAAGTRTLTTTIASATDVATAVWGAAVSALTSAGTIGKLLADRIDAAISSRLAPDGTLATVTNLTNAPDVPSEAEIATAVWAAADKVGYSLTEAERTAIATAVQAGILNESDGQQILNAIVNAIGNQNIDQVALVAAIRADLERTGGTLQTRLASSAYTTPPTASANAVAVWGAASRTVTGGTVDNLVNAPDVPTPEEIADQARIEFAAELSRAANTATTQEVADIVEGAMRSPNP